MHLLTPLSTLFNSPSTSLAQVVKNLPAMRETRVQPLGREDPLEKGMATHSSILAWKSPWTEEPSKLQSMEWQRVGHNWLSVHACTHTHTHTHTGLIIPWLYFLFSVSFPSSLLSFLHTHTHTQFIGNRLSFVPFCTIYLVLRTMHGI